MNNNNEGRTTENLARYEHEKGVIVHQVTELISPTHGMEDIELAVDLLQGSLIIYASVRVRTESLYRREHGQYTELWQRRRDAIPR